MTEEIVGSHLKSERGRGQNQDQTGSSTTAKSLPQIPNVSPPNAIVPGLDAQDTLAHRTSGAPQPHTNNEHPRAVDDGSPGVTSIPENGRPVTRSAPPGAFKRD
jgi:hypothetical protein